MAESSIPNSGLGMYTATPIKKDDMIFHPDIIVNYFDFKDNFDVVKERDHGLEWMEVAGDLTDESRRCDGWAQGGECEKNPSYMLESCKKSCALFKAGLLKEEKGSFWLPDDYYWDSGNTDSMYEADEVSSLVPGLGALANSHTGLVNCDMMRPSNDIVGLHRSADPSAGSFSSFHNLGFMAEKDIPAGMELFVQYGDDWFSGREYKFGPLPLSDHFKDADEIVETFWKNVKEDDPLAESLYELTKNLVTDVKLRMAIPETMEKAKEARSSGTAMLTVPNVIRSPEWLEENGICLDNIRADQSSIRQAGRGAFATRAMKRGQVIAPLPLMHIDRRKLSMFEDFEDPDSKEVSKQLILNYSFGHKNSTLLFFPYGPVVNFVNNHVDKTKVNARIRWSRTKYHTQAWEKLSAQEVLNERRAGLMLEFVAIRGIEKGEEIFIDYGSDWDKTWGEHAARRPIADDSYSPVHQLNMLEVIKTEEEQIKSPYPNNIMTICYVAKGVFDKDGNEEHQWRDHSVWSDQISKSRPCTIVERYSSKDTVSGEPVLGYRTTVNDDGKEFSLNGVPRRAIEFVNKKYMSDQHIKNGFRHEIHIPDDIFPVNWMDLAEGDVISDGQTTVHGEKAHWSAEEGAFEHCKYFLAESSIDGTGTGIYAGVDLKPGDFTKNEIAIPAYDYDDQIKLRCAKDPSVCELNSDWLLGNYEWDSCMALSTHDANEVCVAVSGMGALPNHHAGLTSSQGMLPKKAGAGLHRSKDPAAGAISLFEDFQFQITREIPAGMEIFINYGDGEYNSIQS